jgi:hypothetical protein
MKKSNRILQKVFTLYEENNDNYMIIIFLEDNKVVSTYAIPFPDWFKFFDWNYRYYAFCRN